MIAMEEDLVCIFNTVALFLEHQNFNETCEVFRDECESRGFKIITKPFSYSDTTKEVDKLGKNVQRDNNENHYVSEPMSSKPLLEDDDQPVQITYIFEKEEDKKILFTTCATNTGILENIESLTSIRDYLNLKEKFLDLQNQYSSLMDELEEKTRFLDHKISLLQRNRSRSGDENSLRVASIQERNSSAKVKNRVPIIRCQSCEIVRRNDSIKSEVEKEMCVNKYATESSTPQKFTTTVGMMNTEKRCCSQGTEYESVSSENGDKPSYCSEKVQIDTLATPRSSRNSLRNKNGPPQSTSVDTFSKISNINLEKPENSVVDFKTNEIFPKHGTDEVNFLFTRKKCHQTQSAPNGPVIKYNNKSNLHHQHTHTSFSMPISARRNLPYDQYFPLDFKKLKRDLRYGQTDQKLLILQALRWRLTQSTYAERRYVINSYIQNDLLDLQSENSILEVFSQGGSDEESLEGLSRLTNAIVSLKQGRDYICSYKNLLKTNLVSTVQQQLKKCEKISIYLEMLIVILQKLSIRKEQRKIMIQKGILQSISTVLINRRNVLSAYCSEYSFALFMNLCLEEEAKMKCAEDPSSIIKVFSCLLNDVQANYLPYVTGALYSILSEKSVEEEALRQQLDASIYQQMENTRDKYLSKQLEFIIRARFKGESANFTCNESEPSEEIDMLEPELDENDNIKGQVQGEDLLAMYEFVDENWGAENKCDNSIQKEMCNEKNENTSQTESSQFTSAVEEGTNMDSTNNSEKIETSRIKFDAEISTSSETTEMFQNIISLGSLEYGRVFRHDVFQQTLGMCSCLGPAKYNCGCYEAIKQSVEEDEPPVGSQINPTEKVRNSDQASLFTPDNCPNTKLEGSFPGEYQRMRKES